MTIVQEPVVSMPSPRVSVVAYHHLHGRRDNVPAGELTALLHDDAWWLWFDVQDPGPADVEFLRQTFGFHPLALEDILHRGQRPKIESYGSFTFLVLYVGEPLGDDDVRLDELHACLGRNYLVTLHAEPMDEIATARTRWADALDDRREGDTTAQANGIEVALYVLLDSVVDAYFPIVDSLAERLDDLEEDIFVRNDGERSQKAVQSLFRLRKQFLSIRRTLGPQRDVVNALVRRERDHAHVAISLYYLDVYDHLSRLIDGIDVHRETISDALDAHVSVASFKLNQTMKTMTAVATILMSSALLTGVYGMNFQYMPELEWEYGYFVVLGVIAFLAGGLTVFFRRIEWL